MGVPRGTHRVTCTECGASGTIFVGNPSASGKHKVQDSIPHRSSCSLFVRPQPAHLQQKGTWQRQEARANRLVGARATLASGAVRSDGDGRSFHEWRTESKQTAKAYFDLHPRIWDKLVTGALRAGEEPLLHVELRHRLPPERRVVIRLELFRALSDAELHQLPEARVTHRVSAESLTPVLVPFDPPGVELHEAELARLLEELNEAG